MNVNFEKWHGCRNDFILIWTNANEEKYLTLSLKLQAPKICSRNGQGIGADGIILLFENPGTNQLQVVIVNADGTLAQNCGNGLRCAAASFFKRQAHMEPAKTPNFLELKIFDTSFHADLLARDKDDRFFVSVHMGIPSFQEEIPWFSEAQTALGKMKPEGVAKDLLSNWSACKLGNQHLVFYGDVDSDRLSQSLDQLGPELQKIDLWDGINVHVASEVSWGVTEKNQAALQLGGVIGEVFQAYSWERGVGRTEACGSGACAIAHTLLAEGFCERDKWHAIVMPGGNLFVKQSEARGSLLLAGEALPVFSGCFDL